jgi:hypothetical protein
MVPPVLQAIVLADRVYRDAATNKYLIIGTFNKVQRRKKKVVPTGETAVVTGEEVFDSGTPSLYLALRGIRTPIDLRIRFFRLDDETVSFEGKFSVSSDDPVSLVETAVNLPRLEGKAGEYRLDLVYDGVSIGSCNVSLQDEGCET